MRESRASYNPFIMYSQYEYIQCYMSIQWEYVIRYTVDLCVIKVQHRDCYHMSSSLWRRKEVKYGLSNYYRESVFFNLSTYSTCLLSLAIFSHRKGQWGWYWSGWHAQVLVTHSRVTCLFVYRMSNYGAM